MSRVIPFNRLHACLILAALICFLPHVSRGNGPSNPNAAAVSNAPSSATGRNTNPKRQREGLRLNEIVGTFEEVGDSQFTFTPENSKESYRILENLALERIANVAAETASGQLWIVSGQLTEFRGSNYLLISRAVIRNTTPREAAIPEKASDKSAEKGAEKSANKPAAASPF